MKFAARHLILYCLTVAILGMMVSCNWNSNRREDSINEGTVTDAVPIITDTFTPTEPELTIPEETTTSAIIAEGTPLEPIAPQETTPDVQTSTEEITENTTTKENVIPEEITTPEGITTSEEITTPGEITTPEEITTSEEITTPEEITPPEEITTPEEVTPDPPHKHTIINGQCACGFVLVVENASLYDNDQDGKADIFYFSSVLPERFTSESVVHFRADEYEPDLSSRVGVSYEGGETHYYCRKDKKSYIVYAVEVAEAGVYEMAVHQRMKDLDVHGAKFTIDEGGAEKYSFATSYQFATEQALMEICGSMTSSYMFGIQLELSAGVNYIKIELPPGVENSQYFRDFYFVKTSK